MNEAEQKLQSELLRKSTGVARGGVRLGGPVPPFLKMHNFTKIIFKNVNKQI